MLMIKAMIVRRLVRSLCLWLFLLSVSIMSLSLIVNPTILDERAVTRWLQRAHASQAIVNEITAPQLTSSYDRANTAQTPLTSDVLAQALTTSLTPAFVDNALKTIVHSYYEWLHGRATSVAFTIPLTSVADSFYQSLHAQLLAKLQGLPTCYNQPSSAENIVSNNCLPLTYTPMTAADALTTQFHNSTHLFDQPLTPQDFAPQSSQQVPQAIGEVPKVVRAFAVTTWIAWAIGPLCALGAIFLSEPRWRGLKKLGIGLLLTAILWSLVAIVAFTGAGNLTLPAAGPVGTSNLLESILRFALGDIATRTFVVSGGIISLAIVCIVGSMFWRRHGSSQAS